MSREELMYAGILLLGVFLSSISQVMLKKAALKRYDNVVKEYANPLVIGAYVLFVVTTLMCILAYRVIPLSMGPVLEATSYIYVTFFGVRIFREKINSKKVIALLLIISGICVYSFLG